MNWSKEWPNKILHVGELTKTVAIDPATLVGWPEVKPVKQLWPSKPDKGWPSVDIEFTGIDLGTGDKTVIAVYKDSQIERIDWPKPEVIQEIGKIVLEHITLEDIEKVYNNLPPTHDPYTNPNAQIYYQCACGAILDPGTKSFAALNNCASEKGWKIRFGETGYTPYCVKCGEGVE